jgi:hypothetical protein
MPQAPNEIAAAAGIGPGKREPQALKLAIQKQIEKLLTNSNSSRILSQRFAVRIFYYFFLLFLLHSNHAMLIPNFFFLSPPLI